MKRLNDILKGVLIKKIVGLEDRLVSGLYLDSRKLESDGVFFAVKGYLTDGHLYIQKAIENGAIVVICEELPKENLSENVTYVQLKDVKYQMSKIVGNYYEHPDKKLKIIGVTGTNGKTTIATLLYNLIGKMGIKAGLLSTIENKIGEKTLKSTHTTPDVISLNKLLKQMADEDCKYVFMEVSSHAIAQYRIANLDFEGAIFTNLTHDHLDYHGTFAEYLKTKKKFFDNLKPNAFALTNIDDRNGRVMVQNCKARIYSYGLKQMADFKAKILQNSILGLQLKIDKYDAFFKLPGEFNAYNLLAIYGTFSILGFDKTGILIKMSELESASGRFDIIYNADNTKFAICDYAHTPDALKNILSTLVKIKNKKQKIITVFGAGGDRDQAKRPKMGQIAAQLSDIVIITSDNPRTEAPQKIINEIKEGINKSKSNKVLEITDRRQAIKTSLKLAGENDIILIAGKGHEDYQEINGKRYPFNDKEEIKKIWFSNH